MIPEKVGYKKVLSYIGYWIISLTWGGIMTGIGLIVSIVLLLTGHKPRKFGPNIYFVVGDQWGGLELGGFFLVSHYSSIDTIYHEAGHGIQNLIWGPLMPFVISIPSAIRYWYREYLIRSGKKKTSELPPYDSIWFEGQATRWGKKFY